MVAALAMDRDIVATGDESLLAHPLFGGGLPALAEEHVREAGLNYQFSDLAEDHLRRAEKIAPDHFAVLIALYRFYFYKGRCEEARAIARTCISKAAREKNMPADWRDARASDADFGDFEDIIARFFMFSLKGYAYLNMRLGDFQESRAAIVKLLELDAGDKINARLLADILDRAESDDE
jgi:Flp pilus assembly protein TadD